jgi:hypothetical protein
MECVFIHADATGRKKTQENHFPGANRQPRYHRPISIAFGEIWSRDALVADVQPMRDEGVASP